MRWVDWGFLLGSVLLAAIGAAVVWRCFRRLRRHRIHFSFSLLDCLAVVLVLSVSVGLLVLISQYDDGTKFILMCWGLNVFSAQSAAMVLAKTEDLIRGCSVPRSALGVLIMGLVAYGFLYVYWVALGIVTFIVLDVVFWFR